MKSWRTTALGFITGLLILLPEVMAFIDGNPETVADWNMIPAALAAAGLGFTARDNKVTSEAAGATPQ